MLAAHIRKSFDIILFQQLPSLEVLMQINFSAQIFPPNANISTNAMFANLFFWLCLQFADKSLHTWVKVQGVDLANGFGSNKAGHWSPAGRVPPGQLLLGAVLSAIAWVLKCPKFKVLKQTREVIFSWIEYFSEEIVLLAFRFTKNKNYLFLATVFLFLPSFEAAL